MAEEDFVLRRRLGFMPSEMKVPADFDSMGREEIEAAFTACEPRVSPSVRRTKPAQAIEPGNWDGFKEALVDAGVPSDFLSPDDRRQGVQIRDPLDEAMSSGPEAAPSV